MRYTIKPPQNCENEFDYADAIMEDLEGHITHLEDQISALRGALERTVDGFVASVRGKPVRDMDEILLEAYAAMQLSEEPE